MIAEESMLAATYRQGGSFAVRMSGVPRPAATGCCCGCGRLRSAEPM